MEKKACCAMMGYSPVNILLEADEKDEYCLRLKVALKHQLIKLHSSGVTRFMTACDPCIGLWCAEIINEMREKDEELELYCVMPFEEQSTNWVPLLRMRYFNMLEKCTFIKTITAHETATSQLDAYQYMLDQSGVLLYLCGPGADKNTDTTDVEKAIHYAAAKNIPTIFIQPEMYRTARR